ncbi:MAG: glycerol-3-phosphate acyltransferase [Chitinophagales bacterium]|nr:glycerol-3-phosphate acyltransferase [Chitinophagales bacterium]
MFPEVLEKYNKFPLDHTIPDIHEWPINKLTRDKEDLKKEVISRVIDSLEKKIKTQKELLDLLERMLYQERIRLTQIPWKADKPTEKQFWARIKAEVIQFSKEIDELEPPDIRNNPIVNDILDRYINEILGTFEPQTYRFARSIVPLLFALLLNARLKPRGKRRKSIYEKIKIYGDVELVRELSKKGTLVFTPTHFSNLDSLVIGWVIETMGLPGFNYGAGLNLFGIRLFAFFMERLGAYRLDRRKKNVLYLETLKNYSTAAIEKGAHTLFFPGGTRSRSGAIESNIKLGLLGTAMDAQLHNFKNTDKKWKNKIFVVPVVLNYHFVLEAPALINSYLERKGKERFLVENDEFSTSIKFIKFILKFLTHGSEMSVSIAPPLDIFGNKVDIDGNSVDSKNKLIDIRHYFVSGREVTDDKQRDSVYTKMLGDKIIESYRKYNIIYNSQLLAFIAFQLIQKRHHELDLFALMRLPQEDCVIPFQEFKQSLIKLRAVLIEWEKERKLQLSTEFLMELDEFIDHGIKHLGMYHAIPTLIRNIDGDIEAGDMKVLFYYHNRLSGYDFEQYV